ncbi:heme/hemin ABC transporter substrate-binding protein [Algoriphagus hitonicola]|uniref:heme/hemin ABC transporter substrate-binding protein n=1 Tax=Algoriphagus hitonicola TaxID=435880 RepID=UPI0036155106
MKRLVFLFFLILSASCGTSEEAKSKASQERRIITAGGTISEIVAALGLQDQITATDRTSTFPAELQELPSIGYRNQIKAEGILSLNPSLVLIEEGYLNQEVIDQLQSAKIEIQQFQKPSSAEETLVMIEAVSNFFDLKEKGDSIISSVKKDLQKLEEYKQASTNSGTALFVMARGPESLFMAGKGSFATAMFDLAGVNSVAADFENFVPLTPEALIAMNPDHIVLFESGLESLGEKRG